MSVPSIQPSSQKCVAQTEDPVLVPSLSRRHPEWPLSSLRKDPPVVYITYESISNRSRARHREKPPHIEIVVDDDHRRIAASALALDLNHGELAVLRRFAGLESA